MGVDEKHSKCSLFCNCAGDFWALGVNSWSTSPDPMVLILSLLPVYSITTLSTNFIEHITIVSSFAWYGVLRSLMRLDKITCISVTCNYRRLPTLASPPPSLSRSLPPLCSLRLYLVLSNTALISNTYCLFPSPCKDHRVTLFSVPSR